MAVKQLKVGTPEFVGVLHTAAQNIAERVAPKTGLALPIIFGIISSAIPFLSQLPCFGGSTPKEKLQSAMNKSETRTVRVTANKIQRSAWHRNHVKLGKDVAETMAREAIAEALAANPVTVVAFATACGTLSDAAA